MTKIPKRVLLAHGTGGRLTRDLVSDNFVPAFGNTILAKLDDAAVLPELPPGRPALSTDAFVVDPLDFPGGNLGRLSVCGTVNDLAMVGARPLWLTWALILEEGAPGDELETCLSGAVQAAAEAEVEIVAGDTKVVPKGKGDRIYAVTTGLGVVPPTREVCDQRIRPGDVILASGPIGDHGATIMACRHGLAGRDLQSDCAPLSGLVEALFEQGIDLHAMHDPTRGGVTAVCNEVAERASIRIELDEAAIPVRPEVRAVCEILGLDVLGLACEGRLLAWVSKDQAAPALETMATHALGRDSAVIGRVRERVPDQVPVVLETTTGSSRPLDLLSGANLPRIC